MKKTLNAILLLCYSFEMLKTATNEVFDILTYQFNDTVETYIIPNDTKKADVILIFKQDNSTKIENYRPISVLPSTSKIFERVLCKQIYAHMKVYYPH